MKLPKAFVAPTARSTPDRAIRVSVLHIEPNPAMQVVVAWVSFEWVDTKTMQVVGFETRTKTFDESVPFVNMLEELPTMFNEDSEWKMTKLAPYQLPHMKVIQG